MGDAIEQMMLEEQLRQFSAAGVVPGDFVPSEVTEDELVVEGILGAITSPFRAGAKFVSKKAGGLSNIAASVLGGPAGLAAGVGKAVGLPDDVVTAMSPAAAIMRATGGGVSSGLQSKGNIFQRGLAGARGGASGALGGAGKVVRSPLIKTIAGAGAFIFPPLAAVPPAMASADKLLTAVESNDLTKKALGTKAVKNTIKAAKQGDRDAQRGQALLSIVGAVRKAVPPLQAKGGDSGLGYLITVAGKALRGKFIADPKGFPGIMAIPGGRTVRGTWRRA